MAMDARDDDLAERIERERKEHEQDHAREQAVAKETAQRLEREVEQTAQRLERVVEETAIRIENAVRVALAAVGETARVHADAHAKEHVAHERIHTVEKQQVDKAEQSQREAARLALAGMDKRLDGMNEFRQSLEDFQSRSVSREMFDQRTDSVNLRLTALERIIVGRDVFQSSLETRDNAIDSLNSWRAKATGAAVILTLIAGVIGAAIFKLLGGG